MDDDKENSICHQSNTKYTSYDGESRPPVKKPNRTTELMQTSECMYEQQSINAILEKPEFSFLIRYYNMLYLSILPNFELVITVLKQHIEVPYNVEGFLVSDQRPRIRCQKILNYLLVQLNTNKDCKKFCVVFHMISAMSDLSERLLEEFCNNGNWSDIPNITASREIQIDKSCTSELDTSNKSSCSISLEMSGAECCSVNVHCSHLEEVPCNKAEGCCINSHHQTIGKRRIVIIESSVSKSLHLQQSYHQEPSDSSPVPNLVVHPSQINSISHDNQTTEPNQKVDMNHEQNNYNDPYLNLRQKYEAIVQCLPTNYEKTLLLLQSKLTDVQICEVLGSANHSAANKVIVNCLMEMVKCKDDVLGFCDCLQSIALLLSDPSELVVIITEIKSGLDIEHGCIDGGSSKALTKSRKDDGNSATLSRITLQEQIHYNERRQREGIKSPVPPPLPRIFVNRQQLLEEIVTKLCQSAIYDGSYGTAVRITGAGGFGKTSVVTALCHHQVVKDTFKDGIVFIELGPQPVNPCTKLKGLYNLLTDRKCDVNAVEQQIISLTRQYCHNLLVIIDDVWQYEDALPIVRAFRHCKIVLTTRMNDLNEHIPTREVVAVSSMKQNEAISLLTCGVTGATNPSVQELSLLSELAQVVDHWPILLSLIRGQISHNHKRNNLSLYESIQHVKVKLQEEGQTAFDKNSNDLRRNRNYAVSFCINATLKLLDPEVADKLKTLILWNGIGTSLQVAVLHYLWATTEYEARDAADVLWSYGLIQFTDIILPPINHKQRCVEVHAVISQQIIETMHSNEVATLSPIIQFGTGEAVEKEIGNLLFKSYKADTNDSPQKEFLKYTWYYTENCTLQCLIKQINLHTVTDPHLAILTLHELGGGLLSSQAVSVFFPSINDQIYLLACKCHTILKGAHEMSWKLNQRIQQCIIHKNFSSLVDIVESHSIEYPVGSVAKEGVVLIQSCVPYCEGELLDYIEHELELLQRLTTEYQWLTLIALPHIKLIVKQLEDLDNAMRVGSPKTELLYNYYRSGKHHEQVELMITNHCIKLQEVAPKSVNRHFPHHVNQYQSQAQHVGSSDVIRWNQPMGGSIPTDDTLLWQQPSHQKPSVSSAAESLGRFSYQSNATQQSNPNVPIQPIQDRGNNQQQNNHSGVVGTKADLEEQLKRIDLQKQLQQLPNQQLPVTKCLPPPPLPPNYICRQQLLDDIANKLCQSASESNTNGTSVIVTGPGGIGKTSIVSALCHHPLVNQVFTDGFIFIKLGQSSDPYMKLKGLYTLLTNEQCNIDAVEQEINQVTFSNFHNLLVIVDDVWNFKDVEPMIRAFKHCKMVLTTRISNLAQNIHTNHVVPVGPMELAESISLLTCNVVDTSQVSQPDVQLLNELAQAVSQKPLLLCLVRGHLSHSINLYSSTSNDAIRYITNRLFDKGHGNANINHSFEFAVERCIKVTLELLKNPMPDRIKSLILYTGVGTSLPTALLKELWKISESEANETLDVLGAYGLIQFTDISMPPYIIKQYSVEVHDVISQFIIESLESNEVVVLSPLRKLGTHGSVSEGMKKLFYESCNTSSLTAEEYLHYRLNVIEYCELHYCRKNVNMETAYDPHDIIMILGDIQSLLIKSPNVKRPPPSLEKEIDALLADCHKVLKNVHSLSTNFNRDVQHCLAERKYDGLIKIIENYCKNSPISAVALKAVKVIYPYTNEQVLHNILIQPSTVGDEIDFITDKYEALHMKTSNYSNIRLHTLPYVTLLVKELKEIFKSLNAKSPKKIQKTYEYYKSNRWLKERESLKISQLHKLQKVAPNYVYEQAAQQVKTQHTM